MAHQYPPMAFLNCPLGCCPPSMPLDGIYEYGHDPPPLPTSPGQQIEWSSFDPLWPNLSPDTVNAPTASWFQEPYANPFDTRPQQTETKEAQPAEHRAVYPLRLTPDVTAARSMPRSTQESTWGHRLATPIEETPEHPQENAIPGNEILKCQWKDCQYTGTFGRKTDLIRHLETQHVSPRAYKCSFPGCGRVYNRDDNLQGHLRKAHGPSKRYR